jgi:serine/threonine-protein kinase
VFDAGFDEATGMPFLVMELLRGEDLGKRLESVKQFTAAEVILYLHQTALALDKTHRAHIVHRDLKPANLFLCERDDSPPCVKVLDFGIAKLVAEGSTQANATRSLGTPMYMAPEQFQSPAAVTPATDIFALGLIAYTLLVGAPYWTDELIGSGNVFAFAVAVTDGPREPASERAERRGVALPPSFDAWFARATAPSPADRFPTASEAVQALATALGLPQPGHEHSATLTIVSPAVTASAASAGTTPLPMTPPSPEAAAASASSPRRSLLATMGTATAVLVAGAIVFYAAPFRTRAVIAQPLIIRATAIQEAAGAPALAAPQIAPGFASVRTAPAPVPSAVTPAPPAGSRPEIRPFRKAATKVGKAKTIYRRD